MNDIFTDSAEYLVAYKPQNVSLSKYTEELKERFKLSYLKSVYTLDMLAGGVVVLAKDEACYAKLKDLYEKGEFEFTFYIVGVGELKQSKGTLNAFCARDKKSGNLSRVPMLSSDAEHIVAEYELLEQVQKIALVKFKLNNFFEGSLRFCAFDLGIPIFGDASFGGDSLAKNTNLSLILGEVKFNIENGENLNFVAMPSETKPWTYFNIEKYCGFKGGSYGRKII